MFKKGMKWIKKSTKEDATKKVEKKLYDDYLVYGWIEEKNVVKLINTYPSREFALERAEYYKNFYPSIIVMNPYGEIEKML